MWDFEMSKDLKWRGTGNFKSWLEDLKILLMAQGVWDVVTGDDPEPERWVNPTTTTTTTTTSYTTPVTLLPVTLSPEETRHKGKLEKAYRDWRTKEQKALATIRINIERETRRRYDDITTSHKLLDKIKEDRTRLLKKDPDSIRCRLFNLKLEDCGTVRGYYNNLQSIWDDLEVCGQVITSEQKFQYMMLGLPEAWGDYKAVLRHGLKHTEYEELLVELEDYEVDLREERGLGAGRALFTRGNRN